MAKKTLFLHIGLQKTGSSSLQMALMKPDGALVGAGIDYIPSAIAPRNAHHNAAWQAAAHRRYDEGKPGIKELVKAGLSSGSERLFVSSEDFSLLSHDDVKNLSGQLSDFDCQIILCLRNQLEWTESFYAQACKRRPIDDVEAFSTHLISTKRTSFGDIHNRWSSAFGANNVHAIVYENHEDVAEAVASILGIRLDQTTPRRNESLNEIFVQTSQRVLRAAESGSGPFSRKASAADLDAISSAMLRFGRAVPEFSGTPVFFAPKDAQAYLNRFTKANQALAKITPLPGQYFSASQDRRAPLPASDADFERMIGGLALARAIF